MMGKEIFDRLWPEIRLDHAGETGAVRIYRTLLGFSRDKEIASFASKHLEAEIRHLKGFSEILSSGVGKQRPSRILFLWDSGAFFMAYLPLLCGKKWVYGTVAAVEDIVVNHYRNQLEYLASTGIKDNIADFIKKCRNDEIEHRDEADKLCGKRGRLLSLWLTIMEKSNRLLVFLTRRL